MMFSNACGWIYLWNTMLSRIWIPITTWKTSG